MSERTADDEVLQETQRVIFEAGLDASVGVRAHDAYERDEDGFSGIIPAKYVVEIRLRDRSATLSVDQDSWHRIRTIWPTIVLDACDDAGKAI